MSDYITPQFSELECLPDALMSMVSSAADPSNRPLLLSQLKKQADLHWGKDPRVSYVIAQLMIALGDLASDEQYRAMGMMAKGDALRFMQRIQEAHTTLEESGRIFKAMGDEVGWARTRIGRLLTSQEMGPEALQKALVDVEQARHIFLRHQEIDFLVRLSVNLSAFHEWRSESQQARDALVFAIDLINEERSVHHARLLQNLGILEQSEGHYTAALDCYRRAEALFVEFGQPFEVARVVANRASMWMLQGDYRQALYLMQSIHAELDAFMQVTNSCNQIICFQLLGAHQKAQDTARQLLFAHVNATRLDQATIYMYLGESLAELSDYALAIDSFNHAEVILQEDDSQELLLETYARRAYVHLKAGDFEAAMMDAEKAAQGQTRYVIARANLVLGTAALRAQQFKKAKEAALKAYMAARQLGMELLRYQALILLGAVREADQRLDKAVAHYRRANQRVLRVQRGLTQDYRPGYLESAQDALHRLIGISLQQRQIEAAFGTLEEMKSLVVQQHLHETRSRRLSQDNQQQEAEAALQVARERYLELVNQTIDADAYNEEKQALERRMTDLLAEMRLQWPQQAFETIAPTLDDVRASMTMGMGMVEYYSDGQHIYVFTLAHDADLHVLLLEGVTYEGIDTLLRQFRRSIGRALAVGPVDAEQLYLDQTNRLLKQLYDALLLPVRDFTQCYESLLVVPYGILHLIPFHMLYDDHQYLVEQLQIVLRPASGYRHAQSQPDKAGLLALGYNGGNSEFRMEREASRIADVLGGSCFVGVQAVSQQLSTSACQVLHLAAHGKHNLNQPRLSHLKLADGLLFMEDLWQFDLSYDLVMLSACSVGFSHPSGGDELIGLGHSFLYAGAQALVSSLWDVDDAAAEAFTDGFYARLRQGATKSNAMQHTQIKLMHDERFHHPAYWGAFQLSGNTHPL
ncbi:CHAT domain-containing protein [Phototrophicus methaneseepsis]|uniref:CHAT domain-containing protein n=1 Tax=Phototrophicus methaneseepsis TaxID=2710758 RepID=A0A7S8ID83_9CHLR|nr:CHAT domain-containing protein [Phototrophicus methaneseepsis]QPC81297.1 CHAT domain-containing protein [Phototrophicus methaneseepsis]